MRITADPIERGPAHGVSPVEVREWLQALPPAWTERLRTVHLSASTRSWAIASFSSVTNHLVICSREQPAPEVLQAVARELFLHATQVHPQPEWRLSAKQKREADRKVAEYLAGAGSRASVAQP